MKTTTMRNGAGNNPFSEVSEDNTPPLSTAFAQASKCAAKLEGQPSEKEEELFEGAD